MTKTPQESVNFEAAMKALEDIVSQMEREDLPLEEALRYFEHGVALSAQCQQILKAAEQKIELVENSLENMKKRQENS